MPINVVLLWQVTIVTNNVPAVGGESGETRCQGDMEKADMVDGKKQLVCLSSQIHVSGAFNTLSLGFNLLQRRFANSRSCVHTEPSCSL